MSMAAASKKAKSDSGAVPAFLLQADAQAALFDSLVVASRRAARWACHMPTTLMLDENAAHLEVDAIIKAAKLRVEASRLARAVEDATFRLKMTLAASRRARTAVREVLSLPPDFDPDDE